uniref:Tumor necrosis factor receptor member 16 transmembrane domain-containing protein n=1 Tax=Prolemur simus TaxID=1328070 RepID=A0A8C8YTJ1_PROSS
MAPQGGGHWQRIMRGVPYAPTHSIHTDREGVWVGTGRVLSPGASASIIPVYCALLATMVLGLLTCVVFQCWHSYKQRQQLAKAQTAEVGGPNRDQMHGDSRVFLDSPSSLEADAPSQGTYLAVAPPSSPSLIHVSCPRATSRASGFGPVGCGEGEEIFFFKEVNN